MGGGRRKPRAVTSEDRDHDEEHQRNDHHDEIEAPHHHRRHAWRSPWRAAPARAAPRRRKEPLPDEEGKGGAAVTERETISTKQAEQIIPKEKKRNISADARADFEKAMKRYQEARKDDGLSRSECSSVSDAFKRVADDNPGLVEARFNQGAVLYECGRDDEAARIWDGLKYGPAITNLGYIAWKNNEAGRAESLFKRAIDEDPLHSVEARNNMAQIQRDKARKASSSEEKKNYVGQAVSNLRTVLALDSNNLQAFSTLAFIYYDMNMLEMAKLVGNQAIKKAEEIATGKFEEEKVEEANEKAAVKAGKGKAQEGEGREEGRRREEAGQAEGDRARGRHRRHRRHEEAARGRPQHAGPRRAEEEEHQPRHQAVQGGGRAEPELRRGAHEPRGAVAQQPRLPDGGGELPRGASSCSRRTSRRPSASASRCAATRRSTRRRRSTTPPRASTRRRAAATSTSACSTRSTRTARSRRCRRRRTTTASSSATLRAAPPIR